MEDPSLIPKSPLSSLCHPQNSSPHLKIPPSLDVPTLSTSFATDPPAAPPTPSPDPYKRLINSNHRISPSRPIYSDRFIPSRTGSSSSLFSINTPSSSTSGRSGGSARDGPEDSPATYAALIRAAGEGCPGKVNGGSGLGFDVRDLVSLQPPNQSILKQTIHYPFAISVWVDSLL